MTKSLLILTDTLNQFMESASPEWHHSLDIDIPEGLFRYGSVEKAPYTWWATMDVTIRLYYKCIKFSINITEKSKITSASMIKVDQQANMAHYLIQDDLALSVRDARKLLFYLQRNSYAFAISISTKSSE